MGMLTVALLRLVATTIMVPSGPAAHISGDGGDEAAEHGAGERGRVGHAKSQAQGNGQNEPSNRHLREKMVRAEGGHVCHSPAETTRTGSAPLVRKGDDTTVPVLLAANAWETVGQDATAEVGLKLVAHEGRQLATFCLDLGKELQPMGLKCAVEIGRAHV